MTEEGAAAAARLKGRLPKGLAAHAIEPSLEDVFLKIVEPPKPKGVRRG